MEKKYKSLKDFPTHNKNPFIKDLFIKESTKINKIQDTNLKITTPSGEVKGKVVYASETNIDRTPFVKLFEYDFLARIGSAGIEVFVYICKYMLKYSDDKIFILPDDVLSRTKYNSLTPVYRGLCELVKENVLARTSSTNIFWINPSILYKGERWRLNDYKNG
jgi:hypothetical protein